MTTCLVADDHSALRAALVSFLEGEGYAVAGPAADGTRTVAAARAEQPDVALVDYRMPRLSGPALIRAVIEASPGTRVIVYTADGDATLAEEAFAAGASAVVLKEAPLADLARALQAVLAGGQYLDPGIAARSGIPVLTERERSVLSLLALGLQNEEIGRRLGIKPETVRTHMRKACVRLGATTRTQAVATALRHGLIS